MRVLMARWVLQTGFAVLLVAVTACEGGFQQTPETDAELRCRQGGFTYGSMAYANCVETESRIKRRIITR